MLAAGTRLGPYEVVAPLGKGGMGVVYRARDPRLGRDVAIKLIAAAHADDPGTKEQFFTEMRAVAALAHPNILNIFDIGEDAGVRYAVMELVTGYTLSDALKSGRLPSELALDIAAQLLFVLRRAGNSQGARLEVDHFLAGFYGEVLDLLDCHGREPRHQFGFADLRT